MVRERGGGHRERAGRRAKRAGILSRRILPTPRECWLSRSATPQQPRQVADQRFDVRGRSAKRSTWLPSGSTDRCDRAPVAGQRGSELGGASCDDGDVGELGERARSGRTPSGNEPHALDALALAALHRARLARRDRASRCTVRRTRRGSRRQHDPAALQLARARNARAVDARSSAHRRQGGRQQLAVVGASRAAGRDSMPTKRTRRGSAQTATMQQRSACPRRRRAASGASAARRWR